MVPHNYYYPRTLARIHINLRNEGPSGQERSTPSRNLHGLEGGNQDFNVSVSFF